MRVSVVARAATPIPATDLLAEIRALGITHVITVPDTHQKTLLDLLLANERPQLVTACTEDEAVAINAGLWIGGARPMLLIQNVGLFACANSIRGIALDSQIPTFMLIGQF